MKPTPLKRQSLATQVRERIEGHIRAGDWQLGARIPAETELARQFEVSHNTLREALQGLIHAGMLSARPGDGTYVTATDRLHAAFDHHLEQSELAKILQARLAIEKSIAGIAAQNCSEDDIKRLEAALQACKNREGEGIDADMAFHCMIADCTRNPILSEIYRVIAAYLCRHWTPVLHQRQYEPQAIALHDELLDALREHNPAAAEKVVERLVEFGYQSI